MLGHLMPVLSIRAVTVHCAKTGWHMHPSIQFHIFLKIFIFMYHVLIMFFLNQHLKDIYVFPDNSLLFYVISWSERVWAVIYHMFVFNYKTNLLPFPGQSVNIFQEAWCFIFRSWLDLLPWNLGVTLDSSSEGRQKRHPCVAILGLRALPTYTHKRKYPPV